MKGQYDTFVIRIMSENKDNFKGIIQHVRTQEHTHFSNYADMKEFIQNHLRLTADGTLTSENNTHVKD
jgi:hypothetical protein